MRNYRKEKEQCPFYERIIDDKKRSFEVCSYPNSEIGRKRSTNIVAAKGKKECTHGEYKTISSEYLCRVIIHFMKKKSIQLQTTLEEFV